MAENTEFTVERDAKLFEAGDYPDKELNVTEDDLDTMVANHTESPIRIEHSDTPFDGALGVLKGVYRKGKELFGKLAFTDAAWGLIKETGQRALSLGVKRDKSGIAEVSLVKEPRIADAQVFSDGVVGFTASMDTAEPVAASEVSIPESEIQTEVANMPEKAVADKPVEMSTQDMMQAIKALRPDSPEARAIFDASRAMVQFREEGQEELRKTAIAAKAAVAELQKANTETLIARFKREGKITPATERYWRPIFAAKPLSGSNLDPAHALTFSTEKDGVEVDQLAHFAELVIAALTASPALFS
ncbi:MAG: hypothetical protein IMZ62_16560, partial [Chloroflexi bacterium]|nr:hypothetical protein [Chloroflexota bacterium]